MSIFEMDDGEMNWTFDPAAAALGILMLVTGWVGGQIKQAIGHEKEKAALKENFTQQIASLGDKFANEIKSLANETRLSLDNLQLAASRERHDYKNEVQKLIISIDGDIRSIKDSFARTSHVDAVNSRVEKSVDEIDKSVRGLMEMLAEVRASLAVIPEISRRVGRLEERNERVDHTSPRPGGLA